MQATLDEIQNARYYFANVAVPELEAVAPDLIAQMLDQCKKMNTYSVAEDGSAMISLRGGRRAGKKFLFRFCAHYVRNTGLLSRDATH
eukprot:SAG31_NODE_836_length_11643_cov_3.389813_7_plen_88_part_00